MEYIRLLLYSKQYETLCNIKRASERRYIEGVSSNLMSVRCGLFVCAGVESLIQSLRYIV